MVDHPTPLLTDDELKALESKYPLSSTTYPPSPSLAKQVDRMRLLDTDDQKKVYCLAIVKRSGLRSLRDLRKEHIPLLKNIMTSTLRYIEAKFGIPKERMVAYVHYPPSYYHLHVHFSHVSQADYGQQVSRAHLLADVIENLKRDSEYYASRTLTMRLPVTHPIAVAWLNDLQNQSESI